MRTIHLNIYIHIMYTSHLYARKHYVGLRHRQCRESLGRPLHLCNVIYNSVGVFQPKSQQHVDVFNSIKYTYDDDDTDEVVAGTSSNSTQIRIRSKMVKGLYAQHQ